MRSWLEVHRPHFVDLVKVGGAVVRLQRQRLCAHLPQPVRDRQLHLLPQERSDQQFELAIQNLHHLETVSDLDQARQVLQKHLVVLMHLQYSLPIHHDCHHVGLGHTHWFLDQSSAHHYRQC